MRTRAEYELSPDNLHVGFISLVADELANDEEGGVSYDEADSAILTGPKARKYAERGFAVDLRWLALQTLSQIYRRPVVEIRHMEWEGETLLVSVVEEISL